MSGLRERKKQATREAIVAAALRLFDERGYSSTSVAQIAERAQVSPATFFVYFPTKEDVVFADQHRRVEQVCAVLRARGPDEPVAVVLRRALGRVLDAGPVGQASEEVQAVRGRVVAASPELRDAAVSRLFACEQHWAGVLIEADVDLDPLVVHATLGAALGAAVAAATTAVDQRLPLLHRVEAALDLALATTADAG